jgi:hypothetical protein
LRVRVRHYRESENPEAFEFPRFPGRASYRQLAQNDESLSYIELAHMDSAEKPTVHPLRASEPVLSLSKERTVEALKSLEIFPFMLSLSKRS